MTPLIHVTPLSRLSETLRHSGAVYRVSMASPDAAASREADRGSGQVLRLVFHDIAEERPGLVAPTEGDVAALLDFARQWAGRGALVINCYAGISRSPAAAFIVAAALQPGRDEAELAMALRRRAPAATPNARLVELADALLQRNGRMTAAIRAIGRGVDAFEGEPFTFPHDT
ncbi:tyrosine phosphatase family protein [Pseudochelatococcus lubricantis]|uniref:tyrosine phosphatase family protein n=1 Tax=Pseudochelatococcus lubricantis TaxID=1538102 RepID=UPI0035ED3D1A